MNCFQSPYWQLILRIPAAILSLAEDDAAEMAPKIGADQITVFKETSR